MKRRLSFSLFTWASLAAGCIQQLDPNASNGAAAPAENLSDLSSWQVCQSPSCDSPDGEVPVNLETPVIYLPNGQTTTSACDDVENQSLTIRQTYCAGCHEAPSALGGLGFILNDDQLATAFSQTAVLPDGGPQRLLIPGNPYGSRLYQRVASGLSGSAAGMPPTAQAGYPTIPRPTASDLSVLYAWIVRDCAEYSGGYVIGGGNYGPSGTSGAGADDGGSSAGSPDDAGDDGAPG
jgi:hypothetical protein